jgi:hypothetical protein
MRWAEKIAIHVARCVPVEKSRILACLPPRASETPPVGETKVNGGDHRADPHDQTMRPAWIIATGVRVEAWLPRHTLSSD